MSFTAYIIIGVLVIWLALVHTKLLETVEKHNTFVKLTQSILFEIVMKGMDQERKKDE